MASFSHRDPSETIRPIKTEKQVWLRRHTQLFGTLFNHCLSAGAQLNTFLSSCWNLHHSLKPRPFISLSLWNVIVFSCTVFPLSFSPSLRKQACATDMCANYDKSAAEECAVCLYDRTLGKYSCRFHAGLFLHHCFRWQNENTKPKQMQKNMVHRS